MHSEHTKLGQDGRIVIPATLRHELGFKPGDALVLESDGDSLLVRPAEAVLRETQDYFRRFATPGGSVVDGLLADRRAEAACETAEDHHRGGRD